MFLTISWNIIINEDRSNTGMFQSDIDHLSALF